MSCDFVVVAKNEYKCQISTFVFLLKHECTEWRAERCVWVFRNEGPSAPGTKPFVIRNKNVTFRFPKFGSGVGCSDLRVHHRHIPIQGIF